MLIFAILVQKFNFEWSQFEDVGVALFEFLWFALSSLRVLEESCFNGPKGRLDKYFYHWNVQFCYFCTKIGLRAITVSEDGRGTHWIVFIASISSFPLGESYFKAPKVTLEKYFYHWNDDFCYFYRTNGFEQSRCQKLVVTLAKFYFFSVGFIAGIREIWY